ncbi:hypothetical protein [Streptomyces soliscabiei]|uniref:hypothetical protein n=1 Tax=Streptomyces soliscabiei TaxID=588897 RepID=UPI0029ABB4D6|nr:hypothetical protein [Streptomyces sp. NY05-11A]MDX2679942.1 hypothetical protein [Streptomyces sp. NY05-11A]
MVSRGTPDPGPASSRPRIGHYLVGGSDSVLLAQVARELGGEAGVTVRVVGGSPEQPSALAVAMEEARAQRLREEFQGRLLIETDQAVGPYGG